MNNLILIKSGPYVGQRVMAEKVLAQDGLRYRCSINGKTIGLMPNEVGILPDSHPLNQQVNDGTSPEAPNVDEEQQDQALKSIVGIIASAKPEEVIEPAVLEPEIIPEPVDETESVPVPVKKKRGRPRKIYSVQEPVPTVEEPEGPETKAVPAAEAIQQAKNILQGPKRRSMDIVIDFDGTVVTHEFPAVGKDIGAVPVLKEFVSNGHRLILFTMRSDKRNPISGDPDIHFVGGNYLTDAVCWFGQNGIQLSGIQTNPDQHSWTSSPKAYGDIIIDDAALGCPLHYKPKLSSRPFVDWVKVRQQLVSMRLIGDRSGTKNYFETGIIAKRYLI